MKQNTLENLYLLATIGLIVAVTMFNLPYINLWYSLSLAASIISSIIIIQVIKNEDIIQFAKRHIIKTLLFTIIIGCLVNLTVILYL
ncbi:hypothetical protein [Bacillus bombysepticus]|uniref:hypothetical protein n=1 Tax=Bacillus bombysepticus TaxID=658666 RepID=UPI0030171AF0